MSTETEKVYERTEPQTQKVSSTSLFLPADCSRTASATDHVVVKVTLSNGEDLTDQILPPTSVSGQLGGGRLIDGLSEGVEGMCVGERRNVIAPAPKAYRVEHAGQKEPFLGEALGRVQKEVHLLYMEVELTQLVSDKHFQVFGCLDDRDACALKVLQDPAFDMVIYDRYGATPLMGAITAGMFQAVALLLNKKPASMPINQYINVAKSSGHNAVVYATQLKDSAILKSLLKRGADPNSKLADAAGGWSCMHIAASKGSEWKGHLKMLLEYGGDPYAVNAAGQSILDVVDAKPPTWRIKVMDLLNDAIDALDEADEEAEEAAREEL